VAIRSPLLSCCSRLLRAPRLPASVDRPSGDGRAGPRYPGELNPGIHGVSVPIFDHADALCGSLTAFGTAGTSPPTPLGMAPSPALFLNAAAQHTRRIRLGPLVYLLSLYNPRRLIEEVSGGRLELGTAPRPTSWVTSGSTRQHAFDLQRDASGPSRRVDARAADVRGCALPVR
jgi:hypothetical protein